MLSVPWVLRLHLSCAFQAHGALAGTRGVCADALRELPISLSSSASRPSHTTLNVSLHCASVLMLISSHHDYLLFVLGYHIVD